MHRRSREERRPTWSLWTALVVTAAACGGDAALPFVEGVIDRETFIAAYVDLRAETLDGSELALPTEDRDRVLAQHGIDADGLQAFAEAYGRELDFMNGVWSEVERRLEALPPPDSPLPGGLAR
jgi:hypothetical protein